MKKLLFTLLFLFSSNAYSYTPSIDDDIKKFRKDRSVAAKCFAKLETSSDKEQIKCLKLCLEMLSQSISINYKMYENNVYINSPYGKRTFTSGSSRNIWK